MKNKQKYLMSMIGIFGVLFGRILNRVLSNYFGNKGSNIAFAISGAIVLCVILILVIKKYYIAAVLSVIAFIPLIVAGIGLYLNNMNIVGFGILLIFIIYPITIKVIKKNYR